MGRAVGVAVLFSFCTWSFGQSVFVQPDSGISGEFGTWTVTYTAGSGGIAEGGAIRVQLPDAWHSGPRNSANRLQASDPRDDHYVTCGCSRDGVEARAAVEGERDNRLIKHAKDSLDGRKERYVFVVRCEVVRGELREGDRLHVVYGDTSGGSRGYRASAVSTQPEPILMAVDTAGDGEFNLVDDPPLIQARPGAPIELQVHLPSQAAVGESIPVLLSMVDKEWNPVDLAAAIHLDLGVAVGPGTVSTRRDDGYVRFEIAPQSKGVLRIAAEAPEFGLTASSNPCVVSRELPENKIYWGDLHSHTHYSWDGVGADSFKYARNIAGLDFYAKTDHSQEPAGDGRLRGLSPATWDEYTAETQRYHDPPDFVTIHAYECSFGRPYGHHNVFFRGKPGPLRNPQTSTLPKLWEALRAGDALTIPHHTGKFPSGVDFAIHDARFRRNFEMYSGHGLSENYDPSHPLAFEHSLFTGDSRSLDAPTHIQNVWERGLFVSAIASSDDHRAHPGMAQYGLAAVRAPENSRDAIFQALHDRETYATTGAKILLAFDVNGTRMGQTVNVSRPPKIRVAAHGTDTIRWVEVLRYRPGDDTFAVFHRWKPNTLDFAGEYIDEDWEEGAIYYARLRQEKLVRKRIAMAWSSPVWTN